MLLHLKMRLMFIKQFSIVRLRNVCLISVILVKSFNLIPMSKKVRNFFRLYEFFLQRLYRFLRKSSGNTEPWSSIEQNIYQCTHSNGNIKIAKINYGCFHNYGSNYKRFQECWTLKVKESLLLMILISQSTEMKPLIRDAG